MKVAIPTRGHDLSSEVEPRFGRCPRFLIVEAESLEFTTVENAAASMGGGAGMRAAQIVVDQGVELVIAGEVGPKAYDVLEAAGVRVMARVSGTVREALDLVGSQMTEDTKGPTGPARHGR
jgi:predicted Fe-Mo cluster-binding NifX family protein